MQKRYIPLCMCKPHVPSCAYFKVIVWFGVKFPNLVFLHEKYELREHSTIYHLSKFVEYINKYRHTYCLYDCNFISTFANIENDKNIIYFLKQCFSKICYRTIFKWISFKKYYNILSCDSLNKVNLRFNLQSFFIYNII